MCDSENDCGDNSDETASECGGTTRPCSESEFRCNDGRCIPGNKVCFDTICSQQNLQIKVCDGTIQCADGFDEAQCQKRTCLPGHRQCEDGTCILARKWCDRRRDCPNASDEMNCTTVVGFAFGSFWCSKKYCKLVPNQNKTIGIYLRKKLYLRLSKKKGVSVLLLNQNPLHVSDPSRMFAFRIRMC